MMGRTGQRRVVMFAALGVILLAPRWSWAADMQVRLERNVIYYGTQTVLQVSVSGAQPQDVPVVSEVVGLDIRPYGQPGVVRDLFRGTVTYQHQFLITPRKPGVYGIGSVTLNTGGKTLKRGPISLRVVEVPLVFSSAQIEPQSTIIGQPAKLTLVYQGYRPDMELTIPEVEGLTIRRLDGPTIRTTRRERLPMTIHELSVTGQKFGRYTIGGMSLDGVAAEAVSFQVARYVVAVSRLAHESLVVGGETSLHVAIRGLKPADKPQPIVSEKIKVKPYRGQRPRAPEGTKVFSWTLAAVEPGSVTIEALQLPDKTRINLDTPATISIRQSGQGGILACRGQVRKTETIVGEPIVVDVAVYYRGRLLEARLDLGNTSFADRADIKVEAAEPAPSEGGTAQPTQIKVGNREMPAVLDSGEFNNQVEQRLRYAIKIVPLSPGELLLDGLRNILTLHIEERNQRRGGFSISFQSITQPFDCEVSLPAVQVGDPPGLQTPPGYRGATGKSFAFETQLDRTSATALAPLTLTMRFTGESVGPQFRPPLLTSLPDLTRDFDVSGTVRGGEVEDDTITFTQVIRPRGEHVTELPALPLVYYDYEKQRYETVYSLPIPLDVRPGHLVGASKMTGAATTDGEPEGPDTSTLPTMSITSLGANYSTLGHVAAGSPLSPMGMAILLVVGPTVILLVIIIRQTGHRLRPVAARRLEQSQLRSQLSHLAGRDDFSAALAENLRASLQLLFDLPPGEVDPEALDKQLAASECDPGVRAALRALLSACDEGRFATSEPPVDQQRKLVDEAKRVLADLERCKP